MNMYAKKVADIIAAIEEIQASGNPMTREEIFSHLRLHYRALITPIQATNIAQQYGK